MRRLSPGILLAGIIAILAGLAGAYALRQLLLRPEPAPTPAPVAKPRVQTLSVPLAVQPLMPGRQIVQQDYTIQQMTIDQVRKAKYPPDVILNSAQIRGRILRRPKKFLEVFTVSDFLPAGDLPTLQDKLKPGYEAVTIPISNAAAVAGFIETGSIVDVIFRSKAGKTPNGVMIPEVTTTLVERAEVLAVGPRVGPRSINSSREVKEVTVLVRSEDARRIAAVIDKGDLMLALRSRSADDDPPVAEVPITMESLLGLTPPVPSIAAVDPPPPPVFKAEIYRGTALEEKFFPFQPNPDNPTADPSQPPANSSDPGGPKLQPVPPVSKEPATPNPDLKRAGGPVFPRGWNTRPRSFRGVGGR